MNILGVLLSLLVPLFLGYTIITWLFRERPLTPVICAALSFLIGTGLFAVWIMIVGAAGKSLTFERMVLPPFLLALMLWAALIWTRTSLLARPDQTSSYEQKTTRGMLWWFLMGFVAWNVFQVCTKAALLPLLSWDAFATNVFKAKILFFERSFMYNNCLPHPEYPMMIPLLEFWTNAFYGSWSDQLIKGLFPIFYAGFLIIQYHFVRQYVSRTWAAAALALTVSSNLFTHHGAIAYRDLPLAVMNCSAIFAIFLWRKERFGGWLVLAALLSGLTALTKSEGTIYVLIHLSIFIVMVLIDVRKKRFCLLDILRFLIPCGSLVGLFQLYKMSLGLKAKLALGNFDLWQGLLSVSTDLTQRLLEIAWMMLYDILFSTSWGMNWFLLFVAVVYPRQLKWKATTGWLLGTLTAFLFLIWFGFAFSPFYADVVRGVEPLSRILLHIFPIVPVLTILLLAVPEERLDN